MCMCGSWLVVLVRIYMYVQTYCIVYIMVVYIRTYSLYLGTTEFRIDNKIQNPWVLVRGWVTTNGAGFSGEVSSNGGIH